MKLKLSNLHLFLLLILVLALSALGLNVVEGFEGETGNGGEAHPALPEGIKKSDIPEEDEDLYILKSEVVPPVCPKCPDLKMECDGKKDSCPPCPPCARCPEPAFTCKKVPNYNAASVGGKLPSQMPMPMLGSFAKFA